jgi:hypothetical protein
MSFDIKLPNISSQTESGKIEQIKSYLYQLAEQLKWALNSIESGNGKFLGEYVARSDFGEYTEKTNQYIEKTNQYIEKTSTDLESLYTNIQQIVDSVTEIGVWNVDDSDTDKGYWRYRKWKSGAVDMNGLFKVTPETENTLGTAGVYYSKEIYLDLPFEVANFQFTGSSTSYHCFVGDCNSVDGNSKQIRLRLYRFTDFAPLADYNVYVRIIASGKLK